MEKLLTILTGSKPGVDAETFSKSQDLYGEGIIDSFDILIIIDELCAEYGIEIGAADFEREDFRSVTTIYALVQRNTAKG
jgi:acyl carrier protein